MKRNPDTTCQARGCGAPREILITRVSDGRSAQYCRAHAEATGSTYEGQWTRGFTPTSLIAGLEACPRCGRFVMNGARHGYTMAWNRNGASGACGEA